MDIGRHSNTGVILYRHLRPLDMAPGQPLRRGRGFSFGRLHPGPFNVRYIHPVWFL